MSNNSNDHVLTKNDSLRNDMIIVYIMAAICLLAGSVYDFSLSKTLYKGESLFGIILGVYGESPAELTYTAIGAMLIFGRYKGKKAWSVIEVIIGIIFVGYGLEELYSVPTRFLSDLSVVGMAIPVILIDLVLSAGIFILFARASAKASWKTIILVSASMLVTVLAASEINSLLKSLWSRPRMRLISANDAVDFQPWWHIGSSVKDEIIASGVSKGEFASFPSGHATGAAGILMLTWLSYLNDKFHAQKRFIFWGGIIFIMLVSLSRIMMGAHFLSDVTVGFLIGFTVYVLVGILLSHLLGTVNHRNADKKA